MDAFDRSRANEESVFSEDVVSDSCLVVGHVQEAIVDFRGKFGSVWMALASASEGAADLLDFALCQIFE